MEGGKSGVCIVRNRNLGLDGGTPTPHTVQGETLLDPSLERGGISAGEQKGGDEGVRVCAGGRKNQKPTPQPPGFS